MEHRDNLCESDIADEDNMRPLFSQPAVLSGHYQLPNGHSLSVFTRSQQKQKTVRLGNAADSDRPGHPLLFLDNVWPAAYVLSDYLVQNPSIVRGRSILELGAGASLPSCVASMLGASIVVATDYPAQGVIENISDVFAENGISNGIAVGHIWGDNVDHLLKLSGDHSYGFDVILMADVLWKDTYGQHRSLLSTITSSMRTDYSSETNASLKSVALIALGHRPTVSHTPEHDLEFFHLAEVEFHLRCTLMDTISKYRDVYDYEYDATSRVSTNTFQIFIYLLQSL